MVLFQMGASESTQVVSEKTVKVCTTVYEDKDKNTLTSTPEAAQKIMCSTAQSNVDLMREGLRGVSDVHRNPALPSSGHKAISN